MLFAVTCLRCCCNKNLHQLEMFHLLPSALPRAHFRADGVVDSRSLPNTANAGVRAAGGALCTRRSLPASSAPSLPHCFDLLGLPPPGEGGGGKRLPNAWCACVCVCEKVQWWSVKCCDGRTPSRVGVPRTAAAVLIAVAPEHTPPRASATCPFRYVWPPACLGSAAGRVWGRRG